MEESMRGRVPLLIALKYERMLRRPLVFFAAPFRLWRPIFR